MKRFVTLLLALVMVLGLATTAFAAEKNGSITVKGTTAEKTYEIYKIFDLTQSGDAVAYTIDSDWNDFFCW